jgi:hypothetical protein
MGIAAENGFETIAHYGDVRISPSEARLVATARRDEDDINAAILAAQGAIAAIDPSLIATPWFEGVYRRL